MLLQIFFIEYLCKIYVLFDKQRLPEITDPWQCDIQHLQFTHWLPDYFILYLEQNLYVLSVWNTNKKYEIVDPCCINEAIREAIIYIIHLFDEWKSQRLYISMDCVFLFIPGSFCMGGKIHMEGMFFVYSFFTFIFR